MEKNPSLNTDKNYSYYLYEPVLKKRHMLALPTEIMYRYFPEETDIIVKSKNPKDNYRFIFNGVLKTSFEEEKLEEFYTYVKKKENEKNEGKLLPNWWIESDTLRYLQAMNYDIKKVYKVIKDSLSLTEKSLKIIDKRIRFILNYGFIYMHGRDTHFRPIIIIEIMKANELIEKHGYKFEEITQATIFFLNYIVNYMMIPGQIENWILICDLKDIGFSNLNQLKNILNNLSQFRCRVFKNYILNLTGFIRVAGSALLSILGSASFKKIVIIEKKRMDVILNYIRKENLPIKYGGTAPNLEFGEDNIFPPVVPSNEYIKEGEKLNIVSPETYKEMYYKSKPFKPFVIYEKYLKIWEKEEENEKFKNTEKIIIKNCKSNIEYSLNDFIFEFEKIKNKSSIKNKYTPKKIDVNIFCNFFFQMDNLQNED